MMNVQCRIKKAEGGAKYGDPEDGEGIMNIEYRMTNVQCRIKKAEGGGKYAEGGNL
jgi:hypothetical protein